MRKIIFSDSFTVERIVKISPPAPADIELESIESLAFPSDSEEKSEFKKPQELTAVTAPEETTKAAAISSVDFADRLIFYIEPECSIGTRIDRTGKCR